MNTNLSGKDYISTQDWTREELDTALDVSFDLKRRFALGEPHRLLQDKTLFNPTRRSCSRPDPGSDADISR